MKDEELFYLLTEVVPYALQAGKAIMSVYESDEREIEYKEDDSPLTLADKLSNNIIVAGLQKITPHIPIISEESIQLTYDHRKLHSDVWIVDPLDGTREFIYKNGEFCVNIALVSEGKTVLGIMYIPAIDTLFYASKNCGAFMEKNGITCRLDTSRYLLPFTSRLAVSRSHINTQTKSYIEKEFPNAIMIPGGSATKFASLCNGEADMYPRLGTTMEWDIAAPQIILEEAGGCVINLHTKISLTYNKEDLRNPDFIAYSNKAFFES